MNYSHAYDEYKTTEAHTILADSKFLAFAKMSVIKLILHFTSRTTFFATNSRNNYNPTAHKIIIYTVTLVNGDQ